MIAIPHACAGTRKVLGVLLDPAKWRRVLPAPQGEQCGAGLLAQLCANAPHAHSLSSEQGTATPGAPQPAECVIA